MTEEKFMLDIIGKKWFYFLFSALIIVPGIFSLVKYGLRLSIDFTGGTLLEIQNLNIKNQNDINKIKNIFTQNKIEVSSVSKSGTSSYIFRTKQMSREQNTIVEKAIDKEFGQTQELRFESVGPTISRELAQNAILAVIFASIAIVLYIAWSFRGVPAPYTSYKFGICAVAALLHDVLVVVGIFSLFGHFFQVEVDSLFVTAILTVIGFSVHDTIVVFDRIRENLVKMPGVKFAQVVNESILQTLARSLSTSLTVLFTLLALLLFGGETIKWFIVALLVGIASGTYSSIFNASPLLVIWEEKK
ncbi:MAG: protein translocase subunit SecF [Patescibacteria group bacterium]|nr:protein translocase subunit SecF [Patescibacteria group bacterium]